MRYKFRAEEIEPSASYPSSVIYRPKIPMWVGVGDGPRLPFLGLLDTGADDTKMTLSQAERLGISLDRTQRVAFHAAVGSTFGCFGEVTMELRQSPRSYVWSVQVAFLPDPVNFPPDEQAKVVLGHTSFFRYFNAAFDFQRGRVELKPNALFKGLPR